MRRTLVPLLAVLACAAPASAQTTIGWEFQPDYVDPALGYTMTSWSITSSTHLGLITYARAEGGNGMALIPAAAEAMPAISPDGLTYTVKLRSGLRYTNGRRVRAGDFEASIRRMRRMKSGGASFYDGIADIAARGRTITIRLKAPDDQFQHILAMPFAAIVPAGTPARNLTRRPPPGIGQFRITRSTSKAVTLRRARALRIPGLRRPRLGTVKHVFTKHFRRASVTIDATSGRRLPLASTYYWFLNTQTPPFDKPEVRRAVHIGLDKDALVRAAGGFMAKSCAFLPVLVMDTGPCPFGDTPNLAAAQAAIRAAGAAGAPVTVYGNTETSTKAVVEEYARQLTAMGLAATPKLVDGEVYFQTIGKDGERPQTGFANWFADFPHPANFLFLVDPDSNQPTNNQNFARVSDPEVKAMIDQGRYEEAARRVVDQAYVVPWATRDLFVQSKAPARCVVVHPMLGVDAAQLCR